MDKFLEVKSKQHIRAFAQESVRKPILRTQMAKPLVPVQSGYVSRLIIPNTNEIYHRKISTMSVLRILRSPIVKDVALQMMSALTAIGPRTRNPLTGKCVPVSK